MVHTPDWGGSQKNAPPVYLVDIFIPLAPNSTLHPHSPGPPSSLETEVTHSVRRLQQLEAYLGGELPQEGSGITWRDEREALLNTISVSWCTRTRTYTHTANQLPYSLLGYNGHSLLIPRTMSERVCGRGQSPNYSTSVSPPSPRSSHCRRQKLPR